MAASATTVEVVQVDGLGSVLADPQGKALYVSDEETASADVLCTDTCTEFWTPLEAAGAPPTGAPDGTTLDVAARPDGTMQVTDGGRRLYTFSLDTPGEATGEGLSDTFGGQQFTWHAVVVDPSGAPAPTTGGSDSGGIPGY